MKQVWLLFYAAVFILPACNNSKSETEKWDIFEVEFSAEYRGNPYMDVDLFAEFEKDSLAIRVRGFYDGNNTYRIRFMPESTGEWSYRTFSNIDKLNGKTGKFRCTEPSPGNHGPVKVSETYHFSYSDGQPFYEIGTTAYAWIHQGDSLEEITLESLGHSPFNKIRMCIFPKSYVYNINEPELYLFSRDTPGKNDYTIFNPEFFHHLEKRLQQLMELGIEADLILFHPYDRWGYQQMPDSTDQFYLEYLIARLASFRNVWWSVANEFDFMQMKSMDDWHRFFEIIYNEDPYHHLRSIHNGAVMYDHGLPWVTHASLQSTSFDSAAVWRQRWKKPLVYDECRYEGDVVQGWGNLSPEEMTAMFWKSLITGTYAGHGETYEHPEDILWWSKGGELRGGSPERIGFFKNFLNQIPDGGYDVFGDQYGGRNEEQYVWYFEEGIPDDYVFHLPDHVKFKAEIIDTWNMRVNELRGLVSGDTVLQIPGKRYMAVRFTKDDLLFPVKPVEFISDGNLFYDKIRLDMVHPEPDKIRYTLDGSDPGINSRIYSGALEFTNKITVKARAIINGRTSPVTEIQLRKAELQPPAVINNPEPGVRWLSYTGNWIALPAFDKLIPTAKGKSPGIFLDMAPTDDYFGLVFSGYVRVPEDQVYTFYTLSDDGSAIFVDGQPVVLNDGQHGPREESGQIGLRKGYHRIEIRFFENWYEEVLEVFISDPEMKKQKIDPFLYRETE